MGALVFLKLMQSDWPIGFSFLLAVTGLFALEHYDLGNDWELPPTPKIESACPQQFQANTLYLFYHPHCPCTMSTVRQLQRVQPLIPAGISIVAVAYLPDSQDFDWIEGRITETVRMIPGIRIVLDRDARTALSAGVKVSGHLLYVNQDSALTFSGGIVAGKNHEGVSRGCQALLGALKANKVRLQRYPVFGCPLRDPQPNGRPARSAFSPTEVKSNASQPGPNSPAVGALIDSYDCPQEDAT